MIGNNIIRFDSLNSTSNYVANALMSGVYEPGSVILAQYQTSGRGQRDSKWQSLPNQNLLISFAIPCDFLSLHQQFLISKAVSVGVYDYLEMTLPTDVHIKWPNDILVNDHKIAGILIETKQVEGQRYAIVGLGLNINQMEFDPSLKATSLAFELGQKISTINVARQVVDSINQNLLCLKSGDYQTVRSRFMHHLYGVKDWIPCNTETKSFVGKIVDVDDSGALLVKSKRGNSATYRAKEIKLNY